MGGTNIYESFTRQFAVREAGGCVSEVVSSVPPSSSLVQNGEFSTSLLRVNLFKVQRILHRNCLNPFLCLHVFRYPAFLEFSEGSLSSGFLNFSSFRCGFLATSYSLIA